MQRDFLGNHPQQKQVILFRTPPKAHPHLLKSLKKCVHKCNIYTLNFEIIGQSFLLLLQN